MDLHEQKQDFIENKSQIDFADNSEVNDSSAVNAEIGPCAGGCHRRLLTRGDGSVRILAAQDQAVDHRKRQRFQGAGLVHALPHVPHFGTDRVSRCHGRIGRRRLPPPAAQGDLRQVRRHQLEELHLFVLHNKYHFL